MLKMWITMWITFDVLCLVYFACLFGIFKMWITHKKEAKMMLFLKFLLVAFQNYIFFEEI